MDPPFRPPWRHATLILGVTPVLHMTSPPGGHPMQTLANARVVYGDSLAVWMDEFVAAMGM